MKNYVGVKMVQAEPMPKEVFEARRRGQEPAYDLHSELGYKVVYPDGYESWSPKDVFEKAYMAVGDDNKITSAEVNAFIDHVDIQKFGDKTTVVHATLANGFILTEASSCVDPANYNQELGANICVGRIEGKLWGLLGFVLQCAVGGMKCEKER